METPSSSTTSGSSRSSLNLIDSVQKQLVIKTTKQRRLRRRPYPGLQVAAMSTSKSPAMTSLENELFTIEISSAKDTLDEDTMVASPQFDPITSEDEDETPEPKDISPQSNAEDISDEDTMVASPQSIVGTVDDEDATTEPEDASPQSSAEDTPSSPQFDPPAIISNRASGAPPSVKIIIEEAMVSLTLIY